jgi:hypothetical protein
MTEDEIKSWKAKIDAMSQEDMCRLWRFSPPGNPIFDSTGPLYAYFDAKFKALGGFTPGISKRIGW